MTPWQRRLRFGLGVFILVFAAALFFSLRRPAPRPEAAATPKGDPGSVAEYARGTYTQAKGTNQEIELQYERLVTYANGTSRLSGVNAKVPGAEGRDFTVTSREAEVAGGTSEVVLRGDVEFRSSDGLVLHTEEAHFGMKDGSVQAPGAVSFSRGRLSGKGVGLSFDRDRDIVSLLDKVRMVVAADEQGQGAATIDSGTATLARRDNYIRFESGMTMVRPTGRMEADTALARMTEDEQRVRQIDLRGGSRVTGDGSDAGGLEAMNARDIDLIYGDEGEALQRALLVGGGSIVLKGTDGGGSRRLAGETIDIALSPDGTVVTGLDVRQRVRLDLPAQGPTPARKITSDVLAARGTSEAGLTSASFSGGVNFVETPDAKRPPRKAVAARMDLELDRGFEAIRTARFAGGTTFDEGTLHASARDARYDVAAGSLHLVGADQRTGQAPQVVDDQATIEAREIDVGLDGRRIQANGAVKSDLRPAPRDASAGTIGARTEPARLPSMLKQDLPVSGTADSLAYDGEASRLVYTGNAQVWQADTSIKGDTVTLDDKRGDLSASGSVVSTMVLEQVNEQTKAKEIVRSVATSENLVYEEAIRRAVYSGNARLRGPQGEITASTIEVHLREGGSEVQRLEAYPAKASAKPGGSGPQPADPALVSVLTPDGRRAFGTRLTYFGDDERYVMVGAPVRITEECRETTGKILTFFRSADRIVVDGNEQKRTEVKGSGGCSAPRLD